MLVSCLTYHFGAREADRNVAGKRVGHERMVMSQVSGKSRVWVLGFTQERIQEQAIVK